MNPVMDGALPTAPASAPPTDLRLVWRPMGAADLDVVAEVAKTAHAHPWRRRHYEDSLAVGHWARVLARRPDPRHDPPHWVHAPVTPEGDWLLGFLVAMPGVEEGHLLDITVAPVHQRHGWGGWMLRALADWGRAQGYAHLWLEVRRSNAAARALYARSGWVEAGLRKGYYPDTAQRREDAIVMRLDLCPAPNATATTR